MTRPEKTELSDAELLRFSRQILLPEWDIEAQLKLSNARVLMVGMGGIGCPSASLLARAGVGFLRLVDPDIVDESNLQRQTLFLAQHVGMPKVEASRDVLSAINPWLEIETAQIYATADDLIRLMADVDLVLDGSDNFATRDAVNQACVTTNTPLISASAIALEGQLMMVLPHQSACYCCVFGGVGDAPPDSRTCTGSGVLATTPSVMASLQAHASLLYLGLNQTPFINQLLVWDGFSCTQRVMRCMKDPACLVCGH